MRVTQRFQFRRWLWFLLLRRRMLAHRRLVCGFLGSVKRSACAKRCSERQCLKNGFGVCLCHRETSFVKYPKTGDKIEAILMPKYFSRKIKGESKANRHIYKTVVNFS